MRRTKRHSKRPSGENIFCLPAGENLSNYLWEPTWEERQLAHLRQMEIHWNRNELLALRKRAKQLEATIAADRKWVERQQIIEDGLKRIQDYYKKAHDAEDAAEHAALLKRLEKATKDIAASNARAEKRELIRRGVLRGRR
jgi:hypothetical protein